MMILGNIMQALRSTKHLYLCTCVLFASRYCRDLGPANTVEVGRDDGDVW